MGKHREHALSIRIECTPGKIAEHRHASDADHGRAREELATLGFWIVFLINLRGQGNGAGRQGSYKHGPDDKHRGVLCQSHYEVTAAAQAGQYSCGVRGVPAPVFHERDNERSRQQAEAAAHGNERLRGSAEFKPLDRDQQEETRAGRF